MLTVRGYRHRPREGENRHSQGDQLEFNKATLTMDSETTLRLAFNALLASPDVSVLIVGHTDNVGSAAYNKKLSLRRAQTVKSWMLDKE